jgi:hypothetical protein
MDDILYIVARFIIFAYLEKCVVRGVLVTNVCANGKLGTTIKWEICSVAYPGCTLLYISMEL